MSKGPCPEKTYQHVLLKGLEDSKLLAPSWMITVGALKDDAISFWEKEHDKADNEKHPLMGISRLLAPYKWLFEFGTTDQLERKIATLQEAERIVIEAMAERKDGGIPPSGFQALIPILAPSFLDKLSPTEPPPSVERIISAAQTIKMDDEEPLGLSGSQRAALKKKATSPPPLFLVQNGLVSIREKTNFFKEISTQAEGYLVSAGWRFDATKKMLVAVDKHKGRNLLTLCIIALSNEFGRDKTGRTKIKESLSPIFVATLEDGRRGNIQRALENFRRSR